MLARGKQQIALRGPSGRYLIPDPRDGHTPRLGAAGTPAADRETFQLVTVANNRFALRPHGSSALLVFEPGAVRPVKPQTPPAPAPGETLEIYRLGELPAILQTALPAVIDTLVAEELAGKQYDKTQQHKTEKYLDLPAPTLKDPQRKKRQRVLSMTEEYRIQAQLDGPADIRITGMSFLANYADGGPGLILLAVDARLPVRGRVQGKIPDLASVSTGYQLTVQLSAVAEVTARHVGNDVTFGPPAVSDLHVSVLRLAFSNNLLEAARRQLRHVANRELERNDAHPRKREPSAAKSHVLARGACSAHGLLAVAVKAMPNTMWATDRSSNVWPAVE